jgi:hypothetical protein
MGKKILCFLCLISSLFAVDPITNPAIVVFKQSRQDIYRAFVRETQFLKGSVYPIRLVLFEADSIEQKELAKYLEISSSLYEIELQRTSNTSAQPRRVSSDSDMVSAVSKYVGSLGYLVDSDEVIFNDGGQIVVIEVKK